ncbi:MAG TPA: hypothetical protein VIW70_02165 [Rubrivivax sp.]
MNLLTRTASLSLVIALTGGATVAAPKAPTSSDAAQAQYQKERARCLGGSSNQDRETCLKEAGAALAEAKRGTLGADQGDYDRNARERCTPLPDEERSACLARMRGEGTTSGSVESGGVSRELREMKVEPVPVAPKK